MIPSAQGLGSANLVARMGMLPEHVDVHVGAEDLTAAPKEVLTDLVFGRREAEFQGRLDDFAVRGVAGQEPLAGLVKATFFLLEEPALEEDLPVANVGFKSPGRALDIVQEVDNAAEAFSVGVAHGREYAANGEDILSKGQRLLGMLTRGNFSGNFGNSESGFDWDK